MPERLSGTVTLLFTDIEGSTRLLRDLGEEYAEVLLEHHGLIRDVVAATRGREFNTEGDAFFVAFETAREAITCAVGIQRAVTAHEWRGNVRLRVRIGVHAGEVRVSGGEYVGIELHRCARVAAAANGGQVLLTGVVCELARGDVPAGVGFRDLGSHCLKDLATPEHLYQLVIDGVADDPRPPRTLERHMVRNLPVLGTQLVGREDERDRVVELLRRRDVRLVTLLGPGGIGKTRLAIEVATAMAEMFDSGVFFVPLAPLGKPEFVASAIADVVGIREVAGETLERRIVDFLATRELLLVLDNFEHVLAAAEGVQTLLRCPRVSILVTSREPLNLTAEREFSIPPLDLPSPGAADLHELAAKESVALFIARARAVRPEFALTPETAPAVAEICRRLDGLPLAIELAAARTKVLPPPALLQRLTARLDVLTAGPRDLPTRQQTLRSTIDWSYELLRPEERALFAELGVFVGGFTLDAAEAVASRGGDILDGVSSLLNKSLLVHLEHDAGEPRLSMLQTIREYALERAAGEGRLDDIAGRHARFFATLARRAAPGFLGPGQREWIERIAADHDNIRAALRWSLDRDEHETLLQLCGSMWGFWDRVGSVAEAADWLSQALEQTKDDRSVLRAAVACGAGCVALSCGDSDRSIALLESARSLSHDLGDVRGEAWSANNLGLTLADDGRLDEAEALHEQSLALARQVDDRWLIASVSLNLGNIAYFRQEWDRALALEQEALQLSDELGDTWRGALALMNIGLIYVEQHQGQPARAHLAEALGRFRHIGSRRYLPDVLEGFSAIAAFDGDVEAAGKLFGAAESLREELGTRITEAAAANALRLCRGCIEDEADASAFEAARTDAWSKSLDEVLETLDVTSAIA